MKKWYALMLILLLLCVAGLSIADEISVNGDAWFSKNIIDVEAELHTMGYMDDSSNALGRAIGILTYRNTSLNPERIVVRFATTTNVLNQVAIFYKADGMNAKKIADAMTVFFGNPIIEAAREESNNAYTINYAESALWYDGKYCYKICSSAEHFCSVKEILDGGNDFQFNISPFEGVVVLPTVAANDTTTPTATPTAIPTFSPTSTAVNCEVAVDGVRFDKNSIGNTELYIWFKNNGSPAVDRVDFYIECYDVYGNLIKSYNYYTRQACFLDDIRLSKNAKSESNIYWTMYGYSGIKKVRVAIFKYHTTQGKTIEIPEEQLNWKTFSN